ncbi:sigma-54-dependent Fis family transcriptional regulator [bacterium]|nr:sigma-54-dependent Fis family transcriptional regulator [bacterium]
MAERVLIVDDDDIVRESLSAVLQNRGFACEQAVDGEEALQRLSKQEFDVVITDLEMPRLNGIELIERAALLNNRTSFILITAYGSMETAIEALRKGAFDYLLKPLNFDDVAIKVKKLLEHRRLMLENQALRQEINSQYNFSNIIGAGPAIRQVFDTIRRVSDSDAHVLISGNSGTGKELVAKALHYNSPRRKGRFVAINCGAITESIFESELFGHKRGAFTGAVADKEGLFQTAHNGTLFLDEIGELSLSSQAKLLRALETKEILPVGGTTFLSIDARIIAATHRDLVQEVHQGRFREDLYYRLAVIEIRLPSLSERREDIPLLVHHFINKYNRQMNRSVKGVEPAVMQALMQHTWKGEVRELENIIERLMIFASSEILRADDLPGEVLQIKEARKEMQTEILREAVKKFERDYISRQLESQDGHRGKTARALGISEATLYRKMEELGIG